MSIHYDATKAKYVEAIVEDLKIHYAEDIPKDIFPTFTEYLLSEEVGMHIKGAIADGLHSAIYNNAASLASTTSAETQAAYDRRNVKRHWR